MDDNDEVLMAQYGIRVETKSVFHYDGRRYDRLSDAVNYARTQRTPSDDEVVSGKPGDQVD